MAALENFLCNKKTNNDETLVANLLSAFHNQGYNMSVKLYFLFSHLHRFPENLANDKQGELFHQSLMTMEERY